MKLNDMKNMDKDDFLGLVGLQTKDSVANQLLGTLATFGVGLLVGAGVALLLAPKAGKNLRHNLRVKFHRDGKAAAANGREGQAADDTVSRPA